jgi:hypothetical protein
VLLAQTMGRVTSDALASAIGIGSLPDSDCFDIAEVVSHQPATGGRADYGSRLYFRSSKE